MNNRASAGDRASETFEALVRLYGSTAIAQEILNQRISGATRREVVRLSLALYRSEEGRTAALWYGALPALRDGFGRLMAASESPRKVAYAISRAGAGRHFSPLDVKTAVAVVLAAIDAENRN